ncbi:hypothetical protein WICPIJ_001579 [Wickerhamomyces pijperi]|uniref:Uncharacterized protein n=1 Tax=Wickerhamomyces pijperi TaxID=599730 RepID=A0A9P8TQP0_WICPI|nr:hypothetical protein WICPIJ_001579 [Wickerhamomyces pijperi]
MEEGNSSRSKSGTAKGEDAKEVPSWLEMSREYLFSSLSEELGAKKEKSPSMSSFLMSWEEAASPWKETMELDLEKPWVLDEDGDW